MNTTESARGRAVVVQPDEGPSFWQPVPLLAELAAAGKTFA